MLSSGILGDILGLVVDGGNRLRYTAKLDTERLNLARGVFYTSPLQSSGSGAAVNLMFNRKLI